MDWETDLKNTNCSEAHLIGRQFDENWKFVAGTHAHSGGQLFMATRGMGVLEIDQGRWLIPPGRCVWVPPHCLHSGVCLGRYAGWLAVFSPEASAALPRRVRVIDSSPLFGEILVRLSASSLSGSWTVQQQRLFAVLCDEILHGKEHRLHLPMPVDHRLIAIVRALTDNIADARSMDEWARLAGMSKRTLTRTFRQQMGMTFHQWKQQLRIFQALELLVRKESVSDIAMAVGYENTSSFIAMFRSVLGTSPKAYLSQLTLSRTGSIARCRGASA